MLPGCAIIVPKWERLPSRHYTYPRRSLMKRPSHCQQQRKIDRGGLLTAHCYLAALFHNLEVVKQETSPP